VRGNGSVARISFGPQVASVVARALHEAQPDVIHVHEPLVPSVSMHAVLNANAPVVATFHSNVGRERMSSLWFQLAAPMMKPVWNRIARRVAVSEAARHSVTSRMGGDDLVIVPNGVDVERFAGARAAKLRRDATCCSSAGSRSGRASRWRWRHSRNWRACIPT
jgi:phosphatidylinositol alpha-mannosyltransferase